MSRVDDISKGRRGTGARALRPLASEEVDARVAEGARLFVDATLPESSGGPGWQGDEPTGARRARLREQIEGETYGAMRGFLSDELTIVSKLEGPDGIPAAERERQIARSALSGLSKAELQRAAVAIGLPKSGNKEDIVDRLMASFGADRQAISLLIRSVERHTHEGRRHAARLFTFDDLGDPDVVAATLASYGERYVRTDVASWFVLTGVEIDDAELGVDGHLRTYDVDVGAVELRAEEKDFDVKLRVVRHEPILRAYTRHEAEAIAGVEAFALLIGHLPLRPLAWVARAQLPWGNAGGLRLETTWLLGLLLGLLSDDEMTLQDVTSAAFERPRGDRSGAIGTNVPHVGSARLRGQHVLDSQSACRHLASGERLHAVTAMIRFVRDDGSAATLPVRISLEADYIAVMTGFGGLGADATRTMHRKVEGYVASQLIRPEVRGDRLHSVVSRMLARADDADPPQVADLFVPREGAEIRLERR